MRILRIRACCKTLRNESVSESKINKKKNKSFEYSQVKIFKMLNDVLEKKMYNVNVIFIIEIRILASQKKNSTVIMIVVPLFLFVLVLNDVMYNQRNSSHQRSRRTTV